MKTLTVLFVLAVGNSVSCQFVGGENVQANTGFSNANCTFDC